MTEDAGGKVCCSGCFLEDMFVGTGPSAKALITQTLLLVGWTEYEDRLWCPKCSSRAVRNVREVGGTLGVQIIPAQGTEARRAETGTGSVHDGPVA